MSKMILIPGKIVTANAEERIYHNHAVEIEDGIITNFIVKDSVDRSVYSGEIVDLPRLTLIPGFVQTHVHLCQTLFRGMADDLELLDWLQQRIFPLENSHNEESLKISADLGLFELQRCGTTTILDMGTINHQEIIFEELIKSGQRAFAGKCMIDRNDLFPNFKETAADSLNSSTVLADNYHNAADGRIKYGFAPRFVLSCSEKLLIDTKDLMHDYEGALFHTHSSENKSEVETVRRLTGKENIEYFNSIGVLEDHTVLAHCIHVNEQETETLKRTGTRVAHCPSSNLKLGSGIANIPNYLQKGLSVSLAADGAPCNNNLNIFTEMRLAALMQKPIHGAKAMDAKTVFRLATIEGAKALHLENEIGSIEIGKKADLVLLDLERADQSLNENDISIYANIVYSANSGNVHSVMVEGKWVVRNNISTLFEEKELVSRGRTELKKVIERAGI